MPFLELAKIAPREILPGCRARLLHSQHLTFAFWELDAGAIIPEHSHLHEQVATMLAGEMELALAGETKLVLPGQVAVIPPHTKHAVRAETACRVLDVFYPIRDDYR